MIFLMDYDQARGVLVDFQRFDESRWAEAERRRIELEAGHLQAGLSREVVLLDAASETDLRRTHRRYFETIEQLVASPGF